MNNVDKSTKKKKKISLLSRSLTSSCSLTYGGQAIVYIIRSFSDHSATKDLFSKKDTSQKLEKLPQPTKTFNNTNMPYKLGSGRGMENLLLLTDSYKVSHHVQYPKGTTTIYSYFESRRRSSQRSLLLRIAILH